MADDAQDAKTPAAPDAPSAGPAYGGSASGIGYIVLKNSLLNLLTIGFYRFWGKTRLRRYLWGNISFHGDALEYTGLPKELFIGFLIALGVLIPLGVAFGIIDLFSAAWSFEAQIAVQWSYTIIFLFLFQFAYFRARRYRLTRTTWRSIRGGQTGSAVKYALFAMGHLALLSITVGLTLPLMNTVLQRFRLDNTWLGDRRFAFDGRTGDLFGRWFLSWLFFVPTLGLTYVWYKAAELRYFAQRTTFENLRMELPVTGGQLFGIYALYMLAVSGVMLVITLIGAFVLGFTPDQISASLGQQGLMLAPILMFLFFYLLLSVLGTIMITHRLAALLCSRLTMIGEQDFDAIAQSSRSVPGRGEGLADALDVGGF